MKRNIDNLLQDYYNLYTEDDRLTKDKTHYIEYVTTMKYIDKYIKKGNKIIEIGAGTGAYSLELARKGYDVTALELSENNLSILKNKITPEMNIKTLQGNALDLSMIEDETYDITLVLGPLYHIFTKEEQNKVIEEAIRVTKKDGYIYYAFILTDITFLEWGFKRENFVSNFGNDKMIDENYKQINKEELIFYLSNMEEVKKLINNNNQKEITYVATDGIGRIIKDTINEMDEETYNHYLNYHLTICEREDLIGYSGHIIAIAQK